MGTIKTYNPLAYYTLHLDRVEYINPLDLGQQVWLLHLVMLLLI